MNIELGQIDLLKEKQEIELYLAKPNKTIISSLKEVYGVRQVLELGQLSELEFSVPYKIDVNHRLRKNPNIELIRQKYLVKAKVGNIEEWYVIDNIKDSTDEDGKDVKDVTLLSLPYELRGKYFREWAGIEVVTSSGTEFRRESLKLSEVAGDVLSGTLWRLGYIDAKFEVEVDGEKEHRRAFEFQGVSALDAIFQIAEKFNSIIKWDDKNRTVSFFDPKNIGINRGLKISYEKYLKSLNREESSEDFITILEVYGNEVDIRGINPTGTNYLEDYSYYMYPYKEDENGNVIQSSYYMSDELCKAIITYNKFVETKSGEFKILLDRKKEVEARLLVGSSELLELQEQLIEIQNIIDVKVASGQDVTTERADETQKNSQIQQKQDELNIIKGELDSVNNDINLLRQSFDVSNFFSDELLLERILYDHTTEWSDEEEIDPEILLNSAKEAFKEINKPKMTIDINIVYFLDVVECQYDWDKLVLGDKLYIEYEAMNIDVESQISKVEIDYDNQEINITISNTKNIESAEEKLTKMFYESKKAVSSLSISKEKWNKITNVENTVNDYFNRAIDATKQAVVAGVNESVVFDHRGITITDSNNPNKFLRATHGVLAITNDGGNTFKHAITSEGVIAERLIGKLLIGNNLVLENVSGLFRFDNDGLTIEGSAVTFTGGLKEDNLDPDVWNSVVKKDQTYENGFRWDTKNGVIVSRSDNKIRTVLNATEGISIEKNDGTAQTPNWTKKFYVDSNGLLNADELVARKLRITNGYNEALIDASTATIDFDKFLTKFGKLKAENLEVKGIQVKDLTGETTFGIDMNGNTTIKGNITMTGGSISWAGINKPYYDYSEVGGTKPPYNADNTWSSVGTRFTHIDANGIYTGRVVADQFEGNNFIVARGTSGSLEMYANGSDDRIHSRGASGFRIQSDGSLSLHSVQTLSIRSGLTRYESTNISVETGFNGTGTVLFGTNLSQNTVAINGTLNVTNLNVTGSGGGIVAVFG